ncbi:uncharacterized protein TM35_000432030 [Trypanosoma theileri]|uniref:Uncharacterized protein n=1 Tax=Trypanosoma theileri TaxID=67003 RepID=A0A1X0NIS3_9TRYP|nr:uncharacterized protein TM35_000432030 [Trypanosoma theileri]ORC84635.1 hypothetical protein TM35_000432030 [Trypanosoma theileri]
MTSPHTHTQGEGGLVVCVFVCLEPPTIPHISVTVIKTHRDCIPFPWVKAIVINITEHTHTSPGGQSKRRQHRAQTKPTNKQRGHFPYKMMVCHVMSAIGSPIDLFSKKCKQEIYRTEKRNIKIQPKRTAPSQCINIHSNKG